MQREWRLVDSGPLAAPESAAVDEAMLESHAEGRVPSTLHFYSRSQPTVSLGYFQKASDAVDLDECERRQVAIVRRRSGGSAIFTDPGQLIYAVVVPLSVIGGSTGSSFAPVCSAIAGAIRTFGVDAVHRPVNDIEVRGMKISGSAQLRKHQSVVQHGTVLVDADIETMEAVLRGSSPRPSARVTTLSNIMGKPPGIAALKTAIADKIGAAFGVEFSEGDLTTVERDRVDQLVRTRYGQRGWNLRR